MVSRRKSSRVPKRKSKKRQGAKKRLTVCQKRLQDKIRINMDEYKQGRYKSRKQAIKVSYIQVKKMYPRCKFDKK